MGAGAVVEDGRLGRAWALGVATLGGLVTCGAFPNPSVRPFAVLGPALLLGAVHRQPPRLAAGAGLLYGLAFFVPLLYWLQTGAGTNAWLILALLEAGIVAASAVGLALVSRLPAWPLWAASVWTAQEALRGRWPFGGFTWGRLAFSQDEGPMLRWAAVGGAPLVSFLLVLAAGLLVVGVRHAAGSRRLFSGACLPLAAGALVGAVVPAVVGPLLPGPPPTTGTTTVALVQGNVPRLGLASFDPRQQAQVVRNHAQATFALADDVDAGRVPRPAFVVWPENSTDRDPRADPSVRELVDAAVRRVRAPVVVGAILDRSDGRSENAGVVWNPGTGFGQVYVKQRLVPFGEYVPFREQVTPIFGRLALVGSDFAPGGGAGTLTIAGVQVGDVICYEIAYDDLVRAAVDAGAEVLVVQTNNASFGDTAQPHQQLAMSKVRAVEHGRTVLVAATSGVSAYITADGETRDASRVFTRDVLVHEVPLATSRTLATRAGAWPEWALTVLAGAAVLAAVLRRRGA
jgi:apolipoprotein N-acyltransferase